jgi:hypothetical protein
MCCNKVHCNQEIINVNTTDMVDTCQEKKHPTTNYFFVVFMVIFQFIIRSGPFQKETARLHHDEKFYFSAY